MLGSHNINALMSKLSITLATTIEWTFPFNASYWGRSSMMVTSTAHHLPTLSTDQRLAFGYHSWLRFCFALASPRHCQFHDENTNPFSILLHPFWEALSGICSRTIQHPDSQVNRLCISPDKRLLAAAGNHAVKLYDIKATNPNPLLTLEGHTGNITGVAFHCEGKWMVTSSEDGTVKIWETRSGHVQRSYNHGCPVNDVVIHPNQGEIISCDRGGSIRIWDLAENNCSHQLIPEEDVAVSSVTVASDGSTLCAGNNSGNVFVWHLVQYREKTTLMPITHFKAHGQYITRVLLSPDVKHLATCSADHTAKIWEVKDLDKMLARNNQAVAQAASYAAQATANPEKANGVNGQEAGMTPPMPVPFNLESTLAQHQRWVWDCAFSADSAYLVTACSDHYARLWELNSGQIIRQYNGHHRGAVCVALNDYSEAR